MGVEDRSPISMLVLVEKRYGGKSLLDMIIRWQKYIVATPKGDISYWLDENRHTELQIQRDYGGKIPNKFFTAQLLRAPDPTFQGRRFSPSSALSCSIDASGSSSIGVLGGFLSSSASLP
eukprot:g53167.t1